MLKLHICSICSSELVHPVELRERGSGWTAVLRCPECWGEHSGWFEHEDVERFDLELTRGYDALTDQLALLTRRNFEEWIDRFVFAIRYDHVLAEDF